MRVGRRRRVARRRVRRLVGVLFGAHHECRLFVPALGHKLGVDATRKGPDEGYARVWPPDIIMDEATRSLVTQRWNEYGLRNLQAHEDLWSGQGTYALQRLLKGPSLAAGTVDPLTLRANGAPRLEGEAP